MTETATERVPEVLDNEDGDRWWIVGHVSDEIARLALLATMLGPDGFYERDEAYLTARDAKVARRHFRPDPDDPNEENWIECGMGHPDALAMTVMDAVDA